MNGTVVAVECCYGAELYDPSDSDMQSGICSTYLRDGAYGYFGSSTIAYGPNQGNGQADLICQYFLDEVLNGASLGEATQRARHRSGKQEPAKKGCHHAPPRRACAPAASPG